MYYTVQQFCEILKESHEFNPVIGKGVESEDKKNNEKAVKDSLKRTIDPANTIKPEKKRINPQGALDNNKTPLDVNFTYEPSKEYKERVKAQVNGYPSVQNQLYSQETKENGGLDYEGNKRFYDAQKEKQKKFVQAKQQEKSAGLKSRNLDKEMFKDKTLYNESKKVKCLNFKKTVFLNEEHMLSRIPDDMKVDGNKFYMKDKDSNCYLVECAKDKVLDYVHTKVIGYRNPNTINETFNRMEELYNYNSSDTNKSSKVNETSMIEEMIKKTKDTLIRKDSNNKTDFFNTLLGS